MPVNKDARKRHEIIDECLRNTAVRWYKPLLLERVNEKLAEFDKSISEPQLRKDIDNINEYHGSPIEIRKDGKRVYYEYEDPAFSILNVVISDEDAQLLTDAARLIESLGFPMLDYVKSAIGTIQNRNVSAMERQVIYAEPASSEGLEYFKDLFDSITRETPLKISYKKRQATQPETYIVHPYALKEYLKRWYLWAYAEERNTLRNFVLEGIRDARTAKGVKYRKNTFMPVEEYFKNVIGITIYENSKPGDIQLWFSPAVAPLIASKKLHESQKIENDDHTGLFLTIHVVINPELIREILSYGNDCRVIGPEVLKKTIKSKIEDMCKHYE